MLEPHWPTVQADHHNELVRQGQILARHGTGAMLTRLVPGSSWHDASLRMLTTPTTTKGIADRLGLSPSSASELRAARLVTTERRGKSVAHQIAPLGLALLDANGTGTGGVAC